VTSATSTVQPSIAAAAPPHRSQAARAWLMATLREWLRRSRTRSQIDELDEHLLRDIGLTRAAVRAESSKPFWQA
jgi:uncharacterized protein YjiS (DUF1127 family)